MKKFTFKLLITILVILINPDSVFAQVNDSNSVTPKDTILYQFNLSNNNEIYGIIIEETPRETTIKAQDGRIIIIPTFEILSKKPISQVIKVNGQLVFKNPHPSRYFYGPSALPMEKNELYINSVYFLTAQVQYGLTENFSFGFTTSFFLSPMALTAKYSIKLDEKNHIAFGGMGGSFSWLAPESYWGIGFASYTFGNSEANISATASALKTNFTESTSPLFNFAAHKRLGKNLSFMAEVYHIPELKFTIGGPFLRFYFNKTACWDFGLIFFKSESIFSYNDERNLRILPAFSYTFKFNQD